MNRMLRFEPFIGVWNTTGEVLETEAAPSGNLLATDTYGWGPGRQFLVHHVDAYFDGKPTRSMEILGYDAANRRHFARSFDDQGVSEVFDIALRGRRWTILGQAVRFHGGFDDGWNRLSGLWEMKGKRGTWKPWIRLELVRA